MTAGMKLNTIDTESTEKHILSGSIEIRMNIDINRKIKVTAITMKNGIHIVEVTAVNIKIRVKSNGPSRLMYNSGKQCMITSKSIFVHTSILTCVCW